MVQDARYVDLQRTYVPMDPNSFPTVVSLASRGSSTEEGQTQGGRTPIMPYDGFNFMPTAQGYSSFFGTNSLLGVNALAGNVDHIFIVQKNTFENFAIALKDDGIWTKDLGSGGAWTQIVVLAVPGTHALWSYCVIDQVLYLYRAGHTHYYKYGAVTAYAFTAIAPTFLTMAQQQGIFKAGGRLGYWDSNNSISWSAFTDLGDFVPSTSTLAGNTIFQDIVGKIVNILSHGEGFIVYSTRSILAVRRNIESPMLWDPKVVFNQNGISYREEVCQADPDSVHFANTHNGLVEVSAEGIAEFVIPEISRYLSERNSPIYLQFINGKYLFLKYLDADFNVQRVNFEAIAFDDGLYTFAELSAFIADTSSANADKAISAAELAHRKKYIYDTLGLSSFAAASTPASVPIMSDYLSSLIPIAEIDAWYTFGDPDYFNTKGAWYTWNAPDGTTNTISRVGSGLVNTGTPAQSYRIEANANNFYRRQEMLWLLEAQYFQDWKLNVQENFAAFVPKSGTRTNTNTIVGNTTPVSLGALEPKTFVPGVMTGSSGYCDFTNEGNKYYGVSPKGVWLQRSLFSRFDYGMNIDCSVASAGATSEAVWSYGSLGAELNYGTSRAALGAWLDNEFTLFWSTAVSAVGTGIFSQLGAILTTFAGYLVTHGATVASATIHNDLPMTSNFNYFLYTNGAAAAFTNSRRVVLRFDITQGGTQGILYAFLHPSKTIGASSLDLATFNGPWYHVAGKIGAGAVYWAASANVTETPTALNSHEITVANCLYKELGYTRVTGHGHYSGASFIVDDATSEAVDYTDICLPTPPATNLDGVSYRGTDLPIPPYSGGTLYGLSATVVINGDTYIHPDDPGSSGGTAGAAAITPPIPTGTILFQSGSIEPVYPTFVGAFVLDTHLKKWGKLKKDFKNLFDGYPVNTMAGRGIFPYEHFLPKMMARLSDGTFPIFDAFPVESEICYGKAGYYRKGFTDLEQVIIHHRTPRTGVIRAEYTVDSRNPEDLYAVEKAYVNTALANEGFNLSGRWYNIVIRGHYDLIHLELITVRAGKR